MKTIKIFCLPSHASKDRVSGVDFVRIIQPMEHLNGWTDGEVKIKADVWNVIDKEKADWRQIAQDYDIIYLNYLNQAWGFAAMGAMARKYGRQIVMDFDDNLWEILPDNTAYQVYKKGSEGIRVITAIAKEVDYITCTNSYLKNAIAYNTNKDFNRIEVFHNHVDLDLYKYRPRFRDEQNINIVHFGSGSHFASLQSEEFNKGMDEVLKEYPNVTFKTVGAFIPKYKLRWGSRYNHAFGDVDVYRWIKNKFPKVMRETDILVAPLTENLYNRCKSNVKFLETSSAKKPGVYQNIRQYNEVVEDGKNGFLARTSQDWYEAIKKLIDDKRLRKTMGQEAFKTVERYWQMKDNLDDYGQFFKKVYLDNKKKSVV
jgi:glycosyltransferase involved in cell wall biosynthesis